MSLLSQTDHSRVSSLQKHTRYKGGAGQVTQTGASGKACEITPLEKPNVRSSSDYFKCVDLPKMNNKCVGSFSLSPKPLTS